MECMTLGRILVRYINFLISLLYYAGSGKASPLLVGTLSQKQAYQFLEDLWHILVLTSVFLFYSLPPQNLENRLNPQGF